jgi:hypothetical protein
MPSIRAYPPMKRRFLVAIAGLFFLTAAHADDSNPYPQLPSAEALSGDIARYGAEVVLWKKLWNDKNFSVFEKLTSNLASGDPKWLDIGYRLRMVSDAGASELLEIAFAKALPRAPVNVLEMGSFDSATGAIWLTPICRGEIWGEETTNVDVRAWFKQMRTALKDSLPDNLSAKKQKCLNLLDEGEAKGTEGADSAALSKSVSLCKYTLPPDIRAEIDKRYAGMAVLLITDLVQDDQQLWLNAFGTSACPGTAIGHFKSSKDDSYAVALVKPSTGQPGIDEALIVASRGAGMIDLVVLNWARGVPIASIVRKSAPGIYADWQDSSVRINATQDVVVLEHLEASAVAFVFEDGKFRTVTISN